MASAEENQAQAGQDNETALIDIFYRDDARLNSLVSQISHGVEQEVTETLENENNIQVTRRANIGFSRALGTSFLSDDAEKVKTALQTKKVTYDEIAQRLLAALNIEPKLHSAETVFSQLDIFRGRITIINYKILFDIIPLYRKYASLISHGLQGIESITHYMDTFDALKEISPTGIGFELRMSDGSVFTGNLKAEYLVDTAEIVFSNYGDILPDVWNVLGIVDYKNARPLGTPTNPVSAMLYASNQLKAVLSGNESKGTIIPILIYRELSVA